MTNSYILPAEGNEAYIVTDGFTSGRDINYETLIASGKLLNYSHAYLGTGPVISQQWNNGLCYYSSPSPNYRQICRWLVPVLTNRHTNFKATVRIKGTNAIIRWRVIRSTGLEQTFSHPIVNSASYLYSTLNFTVTTSTIGRYEFILEMQGVFDIESVNVECLPLSSPLVQSNNINFESNNTQTSFYNISDSTFQIDSPLSSAKAKAMIDSIVTLNRRRKVLLNISGLDTYTNQVTNPFNSQSIRPSKGLLFYDMDKINQGFIGFPYWLGSDAMPLYYTVAIYNDNVPYSSTINILGYEIPLPSNTDPKWNIYAFRLRPEEVDQIQDTSISTPLIKFKFGSFIKEDPTVNVNATPILSLSIWGW